MGRSSRVGIRPENGGYKTGKRNPHPVNASLQAAFDPELFRALSHRVVDMLADQLGNALSRKGTVPGCADPEKEYGFWKQRFEGGDGDAFGFLEEFVRRSIRLHHPRYVGHQVCAPAPLAALAGFVGELLNNGMAVYEMGPAATALERLVIERTAHLLGFSEGGGFLTSGGTLGTLTALLGARAVRVGDGAIQDGTEPRWAVMASEEAHYCTARAVEVMGWGRAGLVSVPTDARFKIRVDVLDALYAEAVARGRTPVAFVASACTTSTGSYDDLHAVADFCQSRRLWMHVDAAHGGAVAFCPELRARISGIERADSVVLDFHKLLLTPALATAVLFREGAFSWAAFQQRAQYLWSASAGAEWFNVGRRSFECTKVSLGLKVAALWYAFGTELFAENLRRVHELALQFAILLEEDSRFDLAVRPESNIVCFRLRVLTADAEGSDLLQRRIRAEVVESGDFYLVQTTLRGRVWLRTALMNPFTTAGDLRALLDRLAEAASRPLI